MRTVIALVIAAVAGTTAAQAEEITLFNGKDLTGWVGVMAQRDGDTRTLDDIWKVQDGAIVCVGGPNTWASLHTPQHYTNFRLQLEFKWMDPKATGGNAGVFLRSNPPFEAAMMMPAMQRFPSPMAYQAQIIGSGSTGDIWIMGYDHPNFKGEREREPQAAGGRQGGGQAAGGREGGGRGGQGAQGGGQNAGGGRDRGPPPPGWAGARSYPRSEFAEKPRGEWNSYDITFNRDKLTLKVNGKQVNSATGAPVISGRIGLECEPVSIAFRNIKVTTLD